MVPSASAGDDTHSTRAVRGSFKSGRRGDSEAGAGGSSLKQRGGRKEEAPDYSDISHRRQR